MKLFLTWLRRRGFAFANVLGAGLMVVGCAQANGGSSHGLLPSIGTATSTATSTAATGTLFVLNFANHSMTSYVAGSTERLVSIYKLTDPRTLAADSNGTLYIGTEPGVNVYKMGKRRRAYRLRGVAGLGAIATDASNQAYVFTSGPKIDVFKAGARSPSRSIVGMQRMGPIGIDANQNVYAVQTSAMGTGVVTEYRANDFSLLRTISTGLMQPNAIAFDSLGDALLTNAGNNTVTEYAPGATSPKLTIASGVDGPTAIAIDLNDQVYVANNHGNSITVYKPGTTKAFRSITDGIVLPRAMLFDNAYNLYVATSEGVKVYAPGSGSVMLQLRKKDGVRGPIALAYTP